MLLHNRCTSSCKLRLLYRIYTMRLNKVYGRPLMAKEYENVIPANCAIGKINSRGVKNLIFCINED